MEAAKKSLMEPDSKENMGLGSTKNSGQAHENVSGSAMVDRSTVIEAEDPQQGARETQGTMSRRHASQHKSLSEEAVKQNQEAAEKRASMKLKQGNKLFYNGVELRRPVCFEDRCIWF